MVGHTSTESASWTLVEGDDKPFARIKVLRTLCDGLKESLAQEDICGSSGYLPCGHKRFQEMGNIRAQAAIKAQSRKHENSKGEGKKDK